MKNLLDIYDETLANTSHHAYPVNAEKIVAVGGGMHCAETNEEAYKWARTLTETTILSTGAYDKLSKLSKDYEYMGAVNNVDFHDEKYLLEDSSGFIVGDPEKCIAQVQRFADMGVDSLVMRIDGLPHKELMKSIELFGKYVIPTFKDKSSVVRSSDEILADIRAARPAHYAEVEAFEAATKNKEMEYN